MQGAPGHNCESVSSSDQHICNLGEVVGVAKGRGTNLYASLMPLCGSGQYSMLPAET